jgi:transmembrane sensor
MKKEELIELAKKVSYGSATDSEIARYNNWFESRETQIDWDKSELGEQDEKGRLIFQNITSQITTHEARKIRSIWPRFVAAASILAFLSYCTYLTIYNTPPKIQIAKTGVTDIAPGRSQATLTLANGKMIVLTKRLNGKLAQQGNTSINVNSESAIVYLASGASADNSHKVEYNTLATKNGEQSPPLILSDGTKVWLNTASSITYPTVFAGKERRVEITGEAYFEVIHNAKMPFRVIANNEIIEDIGTHFNVNSYADEPFIKTTLLEGKVKVSTGNKQVFLSPGEQAQVSAVNGQNINVARNLYLNDIIAWKSGLFRFHNASIKTVTAELSRWYNVKFEYAGEIPERKFSGEITRNVNASQVLEILNYYNVHFEIKQRGNEKIILVKPI